MNSRSSASIGSGSQSVEACSQQPVPPVVAPLLHGGEGLVAHAAWTTMHVLDRGAARQRLVGEALERERPAPAGIRRRR